MPRDWQFLLGHHRQHRQDEEIPFERHTDDDDLHPHSHSSRHQVEKKASEVSLLGFHRNLREFA